MVPRRMLLPLRLLIQEVPPSSIPKQLFVYLAQSDSCISCFGPPRWLQILLDRSPKVCYLIIPGGEC